MKSIINPGSFLLGLLLINTPLFSQVKTNQSLNQKKEVKMENKSNEMKQYSLLVRVPGTYGTEQAKSVGPQWEKLLEQWKADNIYVLSFAFPGESYTVSGNEKLIKKETVLSGNLKVVSHIVLLSETIEQALELAKSCPVLLYGGTVEVREVPKPIKTDNASLTRHKAIIRNLYEGILNTRKLELLKEIISEEYTGVRGEKGAEGFAETVNSIRIGFPDIKWAVEDLMAEGNKVMVRWSWKGTNKGSFRGLPASNKEVVDSAIAIYEFSDSKIIKAWIQSDKLGFLQQIGIIPQDITAPSIKK